MAKEGSVAPKERINVTFKPATGGAQEEIELPLKLMVLGDFTQRADDRKIIGFDIALHQGLTCPLPRTTYL